jgi:hypothetical protein
MKYRITYYRPYLPHPERDEPQRGIVIAGSVDEVLDIYSDCHVTHVEELPESGEQPQLEHIEREVRKLLFNAGVQQRHIEAIRELKDEKGNWKPFRAWSSYPVRTNDPLSADELEMDLYDDQRGW